MTNEAENENARQRQALTENELKAVAYFSVGKSSEGGFGGRDVSYEVRFAGNIDSATRRMQPVGNSGYSIGSLQTDLGQNRGTRASDDVSTELVDHYQTWARAHAADRPGWLLNDNQRTQTIADLRRQGNEMTRDRGVDIDATIKSRLNAYLLSDEGMNYVHGRDTTQIDKLMRPGNGRGDAGSGLTQLQGTTLYQNSSLDDQAKLATIVTKLENQAGVRYYPRVITGINNGTLNSVEDVKGVVDRILPNRPDGVADYVEDGVNHALKGAEILNALRNADERSPLAGVWQHVVADPLISPVDLRNMNGQDQRLPGPVNAQRVDQNPVWQPEWERQQGQAMPPLRAAGANPNLPAEYDTVKNLFLSPDQGKNFIHALDQGGTYSYGRPQPEGRNRATAGFYVSGDDFVAWNQDGKGHAFIGGNWRDIDRQNLTRVRNNDGTVDLNITENGTVSRLLHVDPRAPALRPDQQEERVQQQQPPAPQMRGPGGGRPDRDGPDRDGQDREQERPAPPGRRGVMMLDDPQHQNFGMFTTFLALAYDRDDTLKKPHDDVSKQVAGGLVEVARGRELPTVGFAEFSPDGSKVSMTDTKNPHAEWARTAVGDVAQFAGQTLAQSSENVAKINEQLALKQEALAQSQTQTLPNPDDPTPKGPKLT
jgi:hypothetical protein